MNIKALRQRKVDLTKAMRALLDKASEESRELTEPESAEFETHLKSMKANEQMLERAELVLEAERSMGAEQHAEEERTGKKSAADPAKTFSSLGEQLQAVMVAERTQGRRVDPRLMQAAASGMNEAVPSDGGFAVQSDFAAEILRQAHEMGEVLSRVRRQGVNGNGLEINAVDESSRATGSRWGGVQVYWANEADTVTAKKPKFRNMELKLQKLFGLYYATSEVLEDAAALSGIASEAFAEEMTFTAEDCIYRGDGAGKPLGILVSPSLISVAKETSQVADTLVSENVLKMWARLHSRSKKNAVWFVNSDVTPQLPQLNIKVKNVAGSENVGGLSTPIYQFPTNGGSGTLMGRPVIEVEYADTIGNKGDILLADLSQYLLIEKASGMKLAESMHVRFINDEQAFRLTWRLDGQPIWNKPLTPYKGTNTQSPFVTLDAR